MYLRLERKWKKDKYTIGRLYASEVYFSNTLEDTDRGLTDGMTEAKIKSLKIYGKTAIPTGLYRILWTKSDKFASKVWCRKYGGFVPLIADVKGFSGVRIHPGNTADDTLGCILLGENTQKGRVNNSTQTFYRFVDTVLVPAWRRGEDIYLDIE